MAFFLETLLGGLMAGMLYSLVALGFVLIFKASGVFNFAQGAMVFFAALMLFLALDPQNRIQAALSARGNGKGTGAAYDLALLPAEAVNDDGVFVDDVSFAALRERQLDALGDLIERHADTGALLALIENGAPHGLPRLLPRLARAARRTRRSSVRASAWTYRHRAPPGRAQ